MDTDLDDDEKFEFLLIEYPERFDELELIYMRLIRQIYKVGLCYRWDDVSARVLPVKLRRLPEEFRNILEIFLTVGLIDRDVFESRNFITSRGIQKRYISVMASMKRKFIKVPDGVLLLDESDIPRTIQISSNIKRKERKGKERVSAEGSGSIPDDSGNIPEHSGKFRNIPENSGRNSPPISIPGFDPEGEYTRGTSKILLTEDQYTALLVNHYQNDEDSLSRDIEGCSDYCDQEQKFFAGEAAQGRLRRWKVKREEFAREKEHKRKHSRENNGIPEEKRPKPGTITKWEPIEA